jgi:hypothetical protein
MKKDMNNKISKRRLINLSFIICHLSLSVALTSCSDYDDYNTAPVDVQASANSTLWENISNDPQLTKFTALARQCKFSEALNSPRFYTVWAPVDNAFNDEEYQRLLHSDSATILKQFMQQHITEYNYPISAALDSTTIVSLNFKHHPFTQQSFDGISYANVNMPAANGLMHKINGFSEFFNNLYENIDNLTGCDAIKNYIQKYDEYYLDLNASVVGPLVNGKQTYLDSVMAKRNNVIRNIMHADLEDEDSTYCMLIPNDKAWADAYAKIHPCFNYIAKMDYMDLSLKSTQASSIKATDAKAAKAAETKTTDQDSLTCRNIVSDLAFSGSYPRNRALFGKGSLTPEDSVFSTSGSFLINANTVLDHTLAINEMSNGLTRIVDSLTFNSWDTYLPPIVVSRPYHTLKVNRLTTHNVALESLAGRDSLFSKVPPMFHQWLFPSTSKFFTYCSVDSADVDGTTSKPEFGFALGSIKNDGSVTGRVCSGTYHIYVITVPEQVLNPDALVRPYYLRFYLSWTDASNKQQLTVLPQGAKTTAEITTDNGDDTATVTYLGDPGRVNVIDLGEFTFPASYYGLDAYPSLLMMHTKSYTSSANRKKYDQQMRVAGVYLVPKEYNDYWANSSNE